MFKVKKKFLEREQNDSNIFKVKKIPKTNSAGKK